MSSNTGDREAEQKSLEYISITSVLLDAMKSTKGSNSYSFGLEELVAIVKSKGVQAALALNDDSVYRLVLDAAKDLATIGYLIQGKEPSFQIVNTIKLLLENPYQQEESFKNILKVHKMERVLFGWQYAPQSSAFIGMRLKVPVLQGAYREGIVDSFLPANHQDIKEDLWHILMDDKKGGKDVRFKELVSYRFNYVQALRTAGPLDPVIEKAKRQSGRNSKGSRTRLINEEITIDCFTAAENFFLRRFMNIDEIVCLFGRNSQGSLLDHLSGASESAFGLKFAYTTWPLNKHLKLRQVSDRVVLELKNEFLSKRDRRPPFTEQEFIKNVAVECYNVDKIFLRRFVDVYQAAKILGLPIAILIKAVEADDEATSFYSGFYWKFFDDENALIYQASAAGKIDPKLVEFPVSVVVASHDVSISKFKQISRMSTSGAPEKASAEAEVPIVPTFLKLKPVRVKSKFGYFDGQLLKQRFLYPNKKIIGIEGLYRGRIKPFLGGTNSVIHTDQNDTFQARVPALLNETERLENEVIQFDSEGLIWNNSGDTLLVDRFIFEAQLLQFPPGRVFKAVLPWRADVATWCCCTSTPNRETRRVLVFDGREQREIPIDNCYLLLEDTLLDIWARSRGDLYTSLEIVHKIVQETILQSQWKVSDIDAYIQSIGEFSLDPFILYSNSTLANTQTFVSFMQMFHRLHPHKFGRHGKRRFHNGSLSPEFLRGKFLQLVFRCSEYIFRKLVEMGPNCPIDRVVQGWLLSGDWGGFILNESPPANDEDLSASGESEDEEGDLYYAGDAVDLNEEVSDESEDDGGKGYGYKHVEQFIKSTGAVVHWYETVKSAAMELKITYGYIYRICNGSNAPSVFGFRYTEEPKSESEQYIPIKELREMFTLNTEDRISLLPLGESDQHGQQDQADDLHGSESDEEDIALKRLSMGRRGKYPQKFVEQIMLEGHVVVQQYTSIGAAAEAMGFRYDRVAKMCNGISGKSVFDFKLRNSVNFEFMKGYENFVNVNDLRRIYEEKNGEKSILEAYNPTRASLVAGVAASLKKDKAKFEYFRAKESQRSHVTNDKYIEQFLVKTGQVVNHYPSISICAAEMGIPFDDIQNFCKDGPKPTDLFGYRFADGAENYMTKTDTFLEIKIIRNMHILRSRYVGKKPARVPKPKPPPKIIPEATRAQAGARRQSLQKKRIFEDETYYEKNASRYVEQYILSTGQIVHWYRNMNSAAVGMGLTYNLIYRSCHGYYVPCIYGFRFCDHEKPESDEYLSLETLVQMMSQYQKVVDSRALLEGADAPPRIHYVEQYVLATDEIVRRYTNVSEVAETLEVPYSRIYRMCNGIDPPTAVHGFRYRYGTPDEVEEFSSDCEQEEIDSFRLALDSAGTANTSAHDNIRRSYFVEQYLLDSGKVIHYYDSLAEAAYTMGVTTDDIFHVSNAQTSSVIFGFRIRHWKYREYMVRPENILPVEVLQRMYSMVDPRTRISSLHIPGTRRLAEIYPSFDEPHDGSRFIAISTSSELLNEFKNSQQSHKRPRVLDGTTSNDFDFFNDGDINPGFFDQFLPGMDNGDMARGSSSSSSSSLKRSRPNAPPNFNGDFPRQANQSVTI